MSSAERVRGLGFGPQLRLILVFVTLSKSLHLPELLCLHAWNEFYSSIYFISLPRLLWRSNGIMDLRVFCELWIAIHYARGSPCSIEQEVLGSPCPGLLCTTDSPWILFSPCNVLLPPCIPQGWIGTYGFINPAPSFFAGPVSSPSLGISPSPL